MKSICLILFLINLGKDNVDAPRNNLRELGGATKKVDHKPEPISSVLHLVEALALVMLCNYRLTTRRLSVHILRDAKTLLKSLNCIEDQTVIDVIDR